MFVMEVCTKAIKETEPNERLYDFIRSSLVKLDTAEQSKLGLYHIQFLLGLSKHIGLFIQNNYDETTPYLSIKDGMYSERDFGPAHSMSRECSQSLSGIINKDGVRVPKHIRNEILDKLLDFYRYHIDSFGEVRSLEVLRSVFA